MRSGHEKNVATARHILIVHHPDDEFEKMPYLIHLLAQHWRQRGIRVDVTSRIDLAIEPGVVVIPHLDLTRTPPEYEAFFARYATVINRRVTNISKRMVSQNLLTAATDHDGPVMVKTDRNVGGVPEADKMRRRGIGGRILTGVARRMPWTLTGMLDSYDYPVYDNPRAVPKAVWRNSRLVVEKFLPERQGEMFCVRQYTFLGDREINTLAMGNSPIVKAHNVVKREVLSETPSGVRELRASFGFDFGKFDYVMHEGRIVLFDANRTPTYNPSSPAGSPSKLILDLADGIDTFLGEA